MMDQFLDLAKDKLGIGGDAAKQATGGLLGLVKEHAPEADFSSLTSKVPGVSDLISGAMGGGNSGGGGLGGMLGQVTGALGGGGSGGAIAALLGSGLGLDKIKNLFAMLKAFLVDKVGKGLIGSLTSKMPDLGSLLG